MRKAVEKLLEKARKNNFPDDIIKILKREDLSVDIIDRIYHYYDTNKQEYSSQQLCGEINRILLFPFSGSQKEYKEKLSRCLMKYYKDCILGSVNKRRIFLLNNYEGFNRIYTTLLQRNVSYHIIKRIYNFINEYNVPSSDIWSLNFYATQLKNIQNIEFLTTIWSECYMLGVKNNIVGHDFLFQDFGDLMISTSQAIPDQNFTIEKYVKKNKGPGGDLCINAAEFYIDCINKSSELINLIGKNFDLDIQMKYAGSSITAQYQSIQWETEKINKCISLATEIDTDLKLYSSTGILYIYITENGISIKLFKYSMINISKSYGSQKYEKHYTGEPTTMQLYISPSGEIFQKAKYKKRYYPLSVKQLIELTECLYSDDLVKFIYLYMDYLISKNIFLKNVFADCKKYCLIPLTVNECLSYHNKSELIKGKYKKADGINIQWNKRNLNLSYMIIKSMPYVDSKSKEILKQIRTFDLSTIRKINGYQYKVLDFFYEIIRKNIKDNFTKEYEKKKKQIYAEAQNDLSELPDVLPDEQDSLVKYDYDFNEDPNHELDQLIYDYIRMCFVNKNNKIKLNIKSVQEIQNKHDNLNKTTNITKKTGDIKIPKNSIFAELNSILPKDFEWIKTRKRLILEAKVQHHCVWSYYKLINSDKCAIYSYVDKDGSKSYDNVPKRYTIEFRYNSKVKKYYVNQTQGRFDKINSSKMTEYINGLLNEYYRKDIAV